MNVSLKDHLYKLWSCQHKMIQSYVGKKYKQIIIRKKKSIVEAIKGSFPLIKMWSLQK